MKTVGVLGGIGPQATIDFERRFHRFAQTLIPPRFNTGYPPLVVLYYRHPPILLDGDQLIRPLQVDPRLLESARRLGAIADFIVIPSNLPHLFAAQIEAASGLEILNMIDRTLDEVERRQWRRVGVMGFSNPTVYTDGLLHRSIAFEILPEPMRDALDQAILAVMEGRETEEHRAAARRGLDHLRDRGVEGSILGCSEIPLLLAHLADAPDLLNPLEILAEAAVNAALDDSAPQPLGLSTKGGP
jgi:aspartate racemase